MMRVKSNLFLVQSGLALVLLLSLCVDKNWGQIAEATAPVAEVSSNLPPSTAVTTGTNQFQNPPGSVGIKFVLITNLPYSGNDTGSVQQAEEPAQVQGLPVDVIVVAEHATNSTAIPNAIFSGYVSQFGNMANSPEAMKNMRLGSCFFANRWAPDAATLKTNFAVTFNRFINAASKVHSERITNAAPVLPHITCALQGAIEHSSWRDDSYKLLYVVTTTPLLPQRMSFTNAVTSLRAAATAQRLFVRVVHVVPPQADGERLLFARNWLRQLAENPDNEEPAYLEVPSDALRDVETDFSDYLTTFRKVAAGE